MNPMNCAVCGSKGWDDGCSNMNCDLFEITLGPKKWNALQTLIRTARKEFYYCSYVRNNIAAECVLRGLCNKYQICRAVRRFNKAFSVKEESRES